jgi:hypothetical protein
MEGYALGTVCISDLEGFDEAIKGFRPHKMTRRALFNLYDIHAVFFKLTDAELDEIVADCRAGIWNKKIPHKPWYFCLLSNEKKKERFLYMFEVFAAIRMCERKMTKSILDGELVLAE